MKNVQYTILKCNQTTVYNVCVCVCGHRKAKISLGPQLLILLALEVHLKRCHIQGSSKIEIEMFW